MRSVEECPNPLNLCRHGNGGYLSLMEEDQACGMAQHDPGESLLQDCFIHTGNTVTRQRSRVTDTVEYVRKVKWKWAGGIACMKDKRWTIRGTEGQIIKDVRSVVRPQHR